MAGEIVNYNSLNFEYSNKEFISKKLLMRI
jgi:hypothetical protein